MKAVVFIILFITLMPAIYASYIKLSAKLLKYKRITWKRSLTFGLIAVFLWVSLAVLVLSHVSPALGIFTMLPIHLLVGGFLFRDQHHHTTKGKLHFRGAIQLTGVAFVFFIIKVVIPGILVTPLR